MTFADLGLSDELLRAVTESGYDEPTPIQHQAIPSILMGRDITGIAQTGTGKTAAFVLPMIDILGEGRSRARMPRSLILEPTRELAAQVAENFDKYGKYHKLNMALLIGGTNMADQIKKLEKGVDVLIATPGRLMDLFGRGKILLTGCNLLVIDEADRMLDMGFIPDIEEICTKLPAQRQTLLFSATMPAPIKKLADKFLSSPKTIEVSRPASSNLLIDQRFIKVDARKKRDALADLLRREEVTTAIVFSNRKTTVRELTTSLQRAGFKAGPIHGDMEQPERIRELDRFKAGEINILVASDVRARGLDHQGTSVTLSTSTCHGSRRLHPPHHGTHRASGRHRVRDQRSSPGTMPSRSVDRELIGRRSRRGGTPAQPTRKPRPEEDKTRRREKKAAETQGARKAPEEKPEREARDSTKPSAAAEPPA
jgi:superfamily II DNA/RNA helicase